MLKSRKINDEIIRSTIEAISKLQKDAFAPVINRIANFVLPPQSITSRTFCARTSKLDFAEMTTPGRLTIFRITKSLPYDFRRLISASIVMRFYFEVEKRAARLERAGEPPSARTPIILAIDEFQNISDLEATRHHPLGVQEVRALPLDGEPEHPSDSGRSSTARSAGTSAPSSASGWGPEDATEDGRAHRRQAPARR